MAKVYRVAICLSGQLRTWDYCKEHIVKWFAGSAVPHGYDSIEYDYFIHTWHTNRVFVDDTGRVTRPNKEQTSIKDGDINGVYNFFNPKKIEIEDYTDELVKHKLWGGLFRSACKSIALKAKYEEEENFEYNCVVRSRFDILINVGKSYNYLPSYDKHAIYSQYIDSEMAASHYPYMNDFFFLGSSLAMDTLSNIYAWMMTRLNVDNKDHKPALSGENVMRQYTRFGPGTLLYKFMHTHFLESRYIDNVKIVPIREEGTVYNAYDPKEFAHLGELWVKTQTHTFDKLWGVIFDLDGVIIKSDIYHHEALIEAIRNVANVIVKESLIDKKSMMSTKNKLLNIQNTHHLDVSLFNKIIAEKDRLFKEKIKACTIGTNVQELLEYLKSKKIKIAIASNSRLENIHFILNSLGIDKYFDTVVSGQDSVARPKPYPDIIHQVYKNLNIDGKPERYQTFFIEDTYEGAKAGHASPSTVIMVEGPEDLSIELIEGRIGK